MRASAFEYRFRWVLHMVLYALGYWAPWTFYCAPMSSRETVWNIGMGALARTHLLSFDGAAILLLCAAMVCVSLGGLLRVWGSAYVGSTVVHSQAMHGDTLLADGPYRRTRNPLYLGTLLNTFGMALVMPWSGALFAVPLIWLFQVRLALAEEPFLGARFGEAYTIYAARVPRFVPALTPRVPAAGAQPRWLQSVLGEIYVVGVFVTYVGFGWSFNSLTLIKGIVISLGVSLVARAFLPKPKS